MIVVRNARVRARQIALLVPWSARAVTWAPLLAVCALALVVVAALPAPFDAVPSLRNAAMVLAIGVGFVLDDPAHTVVAPSPLPSSWRRGLRLTMAAVALTGVWVLALLVASIRSAAPLPWAALSLEAATMCALTLAVAALAIATDHRPAGSYAAMTPIAVRIALLLIPARFSLLAGGPGQSEWIRAHQRWLALLAVAVIVLAWTSRDPGHRSLRRA